MTGSRSSTASTTARRMWVVWSVALAAYIGRRDAPDVVRRGGAGRRRSASTPGPRPSPASWCCSCWSTRRCRCPSACCSTGSAGAALVVVGALTMAAGQLVLALATTLPLAVTARVLIGTGDALTFISVLSVVTAWFPPRRVPVMTQLTGLVGQLGQVLSAVPLAALLHGPGWTTGVPLRGGRSGCSSRSRCSWWCATGRPAPRRRLRPRRRARCCAGCGRRGSSPAPGSGSGRTWAPSSPARCSACSGACRTWWPGRG